MSESVESGSQYLQASQFSVNVGSANLPRAGVILNDVCFGGGVPKKQTKGRETA